MAEVLVLVDHVDGAVRKTTTELLTIARQVGAPSAVLVGADAEAARDTLARFGATTIYVVQSADVVDSLVAPTAELLAQLVERTSPAAVLLASNGENKEIAARLAIKTGSGQPNLGLNPGNLPLDRVRADATGRVLTTNQGVRSCLTLDEV